MARPALTKPALTGFPARIPIRNETGRDPV